MLLLILVAIVDLDLFTVTIVLLNLLICAVNSKLILFSLAKFLGNFQFSESVFSPFSLSVTPILIRYLSEVSLKLRWKVLS